MSLSLCKEKVNMSVIFTRRFFMKNQALILGLILAASVTACNRSNTTGTDTGMQTGENTMTEPTTAETKLSTADANNTGTQTHSQVQSQKRTGESAKQDERSPAEKTWDRIKDPDQDGNVKNTGEEEREARGLEKDDGDSR
jgi:hypothetical protein